MDKLCQLCDDLDAANVKVITYAINFSKAATIEIDNQYAIFMDQKLIKTYSETFRLLAHEAGHVFTGATHKVTSKYDMIQKHEYQANKWAIKKYITLDALGQAIDLGLHEIWDLAEHFQVDEEFMQLALTYYQKTGDFCNIVVPEY